MAVDSVENRNSLPIVIVGGGFAGVTLAQSLEKTLDPSVEIVVVSRDNHLVFTPMLAEVAARTVSPMHVVVAGRQATKRTRWIAASVIAIDLPARRVDYKLSYGGVQSIEFGDLVIACGMAVNFSEIPGMEDHALPLKSVEDSFVLGNTLIDRFEQAILETDPANRQRLLTTVVLGGGFSGVEVAGHLHDLAQSMCRLYDFPKGAEPRTTVVQRGDRIIPELQHESLSDFALKKLRENGVEVRLQTSVAEITRQEVHLQDGTRLPYGLLVGTVGNTATPLVHSSGLPLERNRIKVDGSMQVEGHTSIWAIGDAAIVPNAYDGKLSPPTAQFALRQANQLAKNIVRARNNEALVPFKFRPQGLLAAIGRRNGVAEIYGFQFSGTVAWILWRAVYFMKMPTLARKIGIAVDWITDALFGQNLVRVGENKNPSLRKEHFLDGDVVYRQGDPSRTLFFIEKGGALVHVDGTEGPVAKLQQGEHFGLSAIEEHETDHSTTVVADGSLDVIAIDRPQLQSMSRDGLTRELVHLLEVRRIRQSWGRIISRYPQVEDLRVRDVMVRNPVVLQTSETLAMAVQKLGVSVFLPVIDSDHGFIGSCTRANVSAALAKGLEASTLASEFASSSHHTLSPDASLQSATTDYLRSGLDQLPVVDDQGKLVGIFGLIEATSALTRGGHA